MKRFGVIAALLLGLVMLTGCGKNPDMTIFMMPAANEVIPTEVTEQVQAQLQAKLGEEKTLQVNSSAMYNIQKLIAELAVSQNGIMVIQEQDMLNFANSEGCTPLEGTFDQEKYKKGFVEGTVSVKGADGKDQEKKEQHLYALPINEMKMFQTIGYKTDKLYAIIPSNAPNKELSMKVLQMMAE
ncbi:hypothetical protein BVG16_16570 [Paenibacillus selenitireducens]|uniref:Lipoprotein n=1 Tax=Paenibacillus selenitireducens TaxID=1324314 RepID=A0A1T2XAF0_9BACL|nr:hypothetical protein [Paenibacillus selenitireducens]OPA76782.1 hypothetical protein BVG16_16570 [Paenibacillus selenitireducens]